MWHAITPQNPADSSIKMNTDTWPEMPQQQAQRTMYVIAYMETGSKTEAAAIAGYKDTSVHQRIITHLKECGSLAEHTHTRAPLKFTCDVFSTAMDYLVENAEQQITTPELIAYLEGSQLLQPPTNNHNFLQHFKGWLAERGLTLQVGAREAIFKITEETAQERLQFVRKWRPLLATAVMLEDIIICDETTFEESPHPKGMVIAVTRANLLLHGEPSHFAHWSIKYCCSTCVVLTNANNSRIAVNAAR